MTWSIYGPWLHREPIRPPCTSYYGHRFVEARDRQAIYCTICGQVRSLGGAS